MNLSKHLTESMKDLGWEYLGSRRKSLDDEVMYSFVNKGLYRLFTIETIHDMIKLGE